MAEGLGPTLRAEYARLVEAHYQFIYRFLYWLHPSRGTAEDLTQETYLRAWRGLATRRGRETADRAWLVAIARRVAQDHARKPRVSTVALEAAEAVTDGGRSPSDTLLEEEADRELRRAVAALPEPYRSVVVLAKIEGWSTAQTRTLIDGRWTRIALADGHYTRRRWSEGTDLGRLVVFWQIVSPAAGGGAVPK